MLVDTTLAGGRKRSPVAVVLLNRAGNPVAVLKSTLAAEGGEYMNLLRRKKDFKGYARLQLVQCTVSTLLHSHFLSPNFYDAIAKPAAILPKFCNVCQLEPLEAMSDFMESCQRLNLDMTHCVNTTRVSVARKKMGHSWSLTTHNLSPARRSARPPSRPGSPDHPLCSP